MLASRAYSCDFGLEQTLWAPSTLHTVLQVSKEVRSCLQTFKITHPHQCKNLSTGYLDTAYSSAGVNVTTRHKIQKCKG
jgi:hypothetical protein